MGHAYNCLKSEDFFERCFGENMIYVESIWLWVTIYGRIEHPAPIKIRKF
jgi:hypothetical protein